MLGRRSFKQQRSGLLLTRDQHPIADESVADARHHGNLADALDQIHRSGDHIRRGLRTAHNFYQLHHIGRGKKMEANDIRRPRGVGGDLVDIKIAGV